MVNPLARPVLGALAAALLASPARPAPPTRPPTPARWGSSSRRTCGGGGQLGAGSAYDPPGVFELEVGVAYELVLRARAPSSRWCWGWRPGASFAIRPGLEWFIPETPFYLRAAFDASTQVGYLAWRWMLLGGGAAIRHHRRPGLHGGGRQRLPALERRRRAAPRPRRAPSPVSRPGPRPAAPHTQERHR